MTKAPNVLLAALKSLHEHSTCVALRDFGVSSAVLHTGVLCQATHHRTLYDQLLQDMQLMALAAFTEDNVGYDASPWTLIQGRCVQPHLLAETLGGNKFYVDTGAALRTYCRKSDSRR